MAELDRHLKYLTHTKKTACAHFPTGVELADDTTALFIYWWM